MRMYKVKFGHEEHGDHWCDRVVVVSGHAMEAINKALNKEPKHLRDELYAEEVVLIGEEG